MLTHTFDTVSSEALKSIAMPGRLSESVPDYRQNGQAVTAFVVSFGGQYA